MRFRPNFHATRAGVPIFIWLIRGALGASNDGDLAIALDSQNYPQLVWTVPTNAVLHLESTTNVASGSWAELPLRDLQITTLGERIFAQDLTSAWPVKFYRLRSTRISSLGAHASQGRRPDTVKYLKDLGASWMRVNAFLDGNDVSLTNFLEADINLVVTFAYRDPANVRTDFGTLSDWPNGGFPFRSKAEYQQGIRAALSPLVPYLAFGHQVWVQCENEIGDVSVAPQGRFWRGTTPDYLVQLEALFDAVREINADIPVILTSFASENLDAVLDPSSATYNFQTNRIITLLTQGRYDVADLHFYGCAEDIPAKVQWIEQRMPAGTRWITTETSGPDFRCPGTPIHWQNNPILFENIEAEQVTNRFDLCVGNGASVCLWFSLFDLQNESEVFNHLGLLEPPDQPNGTPRKKPAYYAFQRYTASHH